MNGDDYREFADCFVTYEEREDEDGDTYTVAVPVSYTHLSDPACLWIRCEL